MATFINNPLTSLCSNTNKSEANLFRIFPLRAQTLGISKFNPNRKATFPSIVCKAVSVQPKSATEVEGLNIAEDVTQVNLSFNPYLGSFRVLEIIRICTHSVPIYVIKTFQTCGLAIKISVIINHLITLRVECEV